MDEAKKVFPSARQQVADFEWKLRMYFANVNLLYATKHEAPPASTADNRLVGVPTSY